MNQSLLSLISPLDLPSISTLDLPQTKSSFLPPSPKAEEPRTTTSKAPVLIAPKPVLQEAEDHFTNEDIQLIVSWLEDPSNFASIYGPTEVNVRKEIPKPTRSSSKGYSELAEVLYRLSKGRLNLSGNEVRERFGKHKALYMKTKALSMSTKFTFEVTDQWEGIYTPSQKLEKLCSCFTKMDVLFKYTPNTSEAGVVTNLQLALDNADEEDTDGEESEPNDSSADLCDRTVHQDDTYTKLDTNPHNNDVQEKDESESDMDISCDSGSDPEDDGHSSSPRKAKGDILRTEANKRQLSEVDLPIPTKRSKAADDFWAQSMLNFHFFSADSRTPALNKDSSSKPEAMTRAETIWMELEKSRLKEIARIEEKKLEWEKTKYEQEIERAAKKDSAMLLLEKEKVELERLRLEKQSELELRKLESENEARKIEMINLAIKNGLPHKVEDFLRMASKKLE
ncbi:hypothetical protein BGZ80_007812 [Entomortierella chlamydospora]|uniref:Uncharacterized protein n=1 Tax=Entomortierella chlamydospora TaxID=101097 RepID=A0A9P6MXX8_9FUNG|nr:hypothetical protein BGZ80_007812 [Entomortierella chlamydospora]